MTFVRSLLNRSFNPRSKHWGSVGFLCLMVVFSFALAMPAHADSIWTLVGVTFNDSSAGNTTTATGSFTTNATNNIISYNITTTSGTINPPTTPQFSPIPGSTYTDTNGSTGTYFGTAVIPPGTNSEASFRLSSATNSAEATALQLLIIGDLAILSSGQVGTATLCTTQNHLACPSGTSDEFQSGETFGDFTFGGNRFLTAGTLSGAFVAPNTGGGPGGGGTGGGNQGVPEPSSILLLGTGLLGAGSLRRRLKL